MLTLTLPWPLIDGSALSAVSTVSASALYGMSAVVSPSKINLNAPPTAWTVTVWRSLTYGSRWVGPTAAIVRHAGEAASPAGAVAPAAMAAIPAATRARLIILVACITCPPSR
jgi:hypothetical protein